jgi:hypothetical protein
MHPGPHDRFRYPWSNGITICRPVSVFYLIMYTVFFVLQDLEAEYQGLSPLAILKQSKINTMLILALFRNADGTTHE